MILKIIFTFLAFSWVTPCYSEDPTSAVEWIQESKPSDSTELAHESYQDKRNLIKPKINKSNLKPSDLNSVGIISSKITGINPNIWQKINEKTLFFLLKSLPNLEFYSAQTFLKRILISQTNAPIQTFGASRSGQFYLLAKLDKLIDIGALDEAENTILQVPEINSELFIRWKKISFLTGRIDEMCKNFLQNQSISKDLSVRIICFAQTGDWNAAALILSTVSSLNLVNKSREKLLIDYLDPDLFSIDQTSHDIKKFDEIDFYLTNISKNFQLNVPSRVKYMYSTSKNKSNTANKILAAETLVRKKSINSSSLLDIYRNSHIEGSTGLWKRAIAVKNLDNTLRRNNAQAVGIAVNQATKAMFQAKLLFVLAEGYATKLSRFSYNENRDDLNDSYAIIFALHGEIPTNWASYQSKDKFITMAFHILKRNRLNRSVISDAIKLVKPNFKQLSPAKKLIIPLLHKLNNEETTKSSVILEALQKSSAGVNSSADDLYTSLLLFLEVNEEKLAKSILVEYLIQHSIHKS